MFPVSRGFQRLPCGRGNIELIRKSTKLSFHFPPLRRHGTVEGNVRQPLVDFLRAIQNERKSGVGLLLALECLEHAYSLVVKALDGRFGVFFLGGFANRALGDRRIKERLELLGVLNQVFHQVYDVLIGHSRLSAYQRDAREKTYEEANYSTEIESTISQGTLQEVEIRPQAQKNPVTNSATWPHIPKQQPV